MKVWFYNIFFKIFYNKVALCLDILSKLQNQTSDLFSELKSADLTQINEKYHTDTTEI